MAKKQEGRRFHRHDEAVAHAETVGGTVDRDRIWVVYPSAPQSERSGKSKTDEGDSQ